VRPSRCTGTAGQLQCRVLRAAAEVAGRSGETVRLVRRQHAGAARGAPAPGCPAAQACGPPAARGPGGSACTSSARARPAPTARRQAPARAARRGVGKPGPGPGLGCCRPGGRSRLRACCVASVAAHGCAPGLLPRPLLQDRTSRIPPPWHSCAAGCSLPRQWFRRGGSRPLYPAGATHALLEGGGAQPQGGAHERGPGEAGDEVQQEVEGGVDHYNDEGGVEHHQAAEGRGGGGRAGVDVRRTPPAEAGHRPTCTGRPAAARVRARTCPGAGAACTRRAGPAAPRPCS
jgi:hypothetical protein